MTIPPSLDAAYELCRRVAAEHGRTYYLSTTLLPRRQRPHVWALYAFARAADDIVDHPGTNPADSWSRWRTRELAAMTSDVAPAEGATSVTAAAWHTMRVHGLDPGLWSEFADSMERDLTTHRYDTFVDLRAYMRGSAAVIGELMAPVLGAGTEDALVPARALGEAFQLTNFIRDIGEDWDRGRLYLPIEDLAAVGVSEADLAAAITTGRPGRPVRELVHLEVDRAFELYDQARPGLALVAPPSRPCLQAAFDLYREIAVRARRRDGDVFSSRVVVPQWRRAVTAGGALARSRPRPAPTRRS